MYTFTSTSMLSIWNEPQFCQNQEIMNLFFPEKKFRHFKHTTYICYSVVQNNLEIWEDHCQITFHTQKKISTICCLKILTFTLSTVSKCSSLTMEKKRLVGVWRMKIYTGCQKLTCIKMQSNCPKFIKILLITAMSILPSISRFTPVFD